MKILISGDFCPLGRNNELIEKKKFSSLFNGFENLKKEKNIDYSIINLECPFTFSSEKIKKTGPNLKTENKNIFKALKFVHFDLITLANNHIQDYGDQGVIDTINKAKKNNFEVIGAGKNLQEARKYLIKNINGCRVGFINIAENEFCQATEFNAGAYTLDIIDNYNLIQELKPKVDKIILIYHGGREHYQLPTPNQKKRFHFFIDNGVDAIIAHHTHCFSGYEYYKNKPIVYSLGNFIFDYKAKYQKGKWTQGMSVILSLEKNEFKLEFIPHLQGRKNDSTLRLLQKQNKKEFLDKIEKLHHIIINEEKFQNSWKEYLSTQNHFYLSSLYIKNFFLRALFIKKILPASLLKNKHNKLLLNLMRCETHHEISKNILENK